MPPVSTTIVMRFASMTITANLAASKFIAWRQPPIHHSRAVFSFRLSYFDAETRESSGSKDLPNSPTTLRGRPSVTTPSALLCLVARWGPIREITCRWIISRRHSAPSNPFGSLSNCDKRKVSAEAIACRSKFSRSDSVNDERYSATRAVSGSATGATESRSRLLALCFTVCTVGFPVFRMNVTCHLPRPCF